MTKIIHPQYIFHNKFVIEDRDLFNSVISCLIPFGAIFGAPLGGVLANKGRRLAIIQLTTVFIIGCMMTTVFNFFALFFGRLIMGICIGAYVTVIPLTCMELSPKSIAGPLGIIPQFMCVTGVLLADTVGFLIPYADDENANTTVIWKHIMGLPIVFAALQLFFLFFCFNYETPSFYEMKSDTQGYEKVMNKLYKNSKYVAVLSSLLDEPSVTVPQKTPELTWTQLFSAEHRRPLIVGILLALFHQTTGINTVCFFSNEIFSAGMSGSSAEFAARLGTFGTGVAAIIAVAIAIVISKHYGRKTILFVGEVLMALLLAFLSNCALNNRGTLTTITAVLFVFVFNASFGSMLWLYVSEILGAKGISLAAFTNLFSTVVFGSFGNIFFKVLSAPGVYLMLFFLQIVCMLYIYYCLIETKGKSKEECSRLYYPTITKEIKGKIELNEI